LTGREGLGNGFSNQQVISKGGLIVEEIEAVRTEYIKRWNNNQTVI
jgi:hypothetical protein